MKNNNIETVENVAHEFTDMTSVTNLIKSNLESASLEYTKDETKEDYALLLHELFGKNGLGYVRHYQAVKQSN